VVHSLRSIYVQLKRRHQIELHSTGTSAAMGHAAEDVAMDRMSIDRI
jgi:hypothetical protein